MFNNTRFQQVLSPLPRQTLKSSVRRLEADRYSKSFTSSKHLIALIYGQMSGAKSLRELESAFNSQPSCHYHLGAKNIKKSTLADANKRRNPQVFRDVAEQLMATVHRSQRRQVREFLYLLDSTPIQLKDHGFEWANENATSRNRGFKLHLMINGRDHNPVYAHITDPNVNDITDAQRVPLERGATYVFDKGYNSYNWWRDIDEAGSHFITRFKKNVALSEVENLEVTSDEIETDQLVKLRHASNRAGHKNRYHGKILRRITVARPGKLPLLLATNNLSSPASEIAKLYRKRWDIELFFKWIKQNLKIKQFLGRNRNAVMLQIYAALITYLLLWLYRSQNGFDTSLHLLAVSLKGQLFNRLDTEYQRKRRRWRREQRQEIERRQYALPL